jgi:hypothetical protein
MTIKCLRDVWLVILLLVSICLLLAAAVPLAAQEKTIWPGKDWQTDDPSKVNLDGKTLSAFADDLGSGKYALIDSFDVIRCGKLVYRRTYSHDYGTIYGMEAKTKGPLNGHLTGPYNYFDPAWHPYYHGSSLHSMQSISKTVTSVIIGIAMERGDFKVPLDTPVLRYFEADKIKNLDDRKRRINLRHILTMSTGLDWNEEDDFTSMEASDDWVQYVIDKPMKAEPGEHFNYSSGNAMLLPYIFKKETGQDIEEYANKYLFQPLEMEHYWKRTPLGIVDSEGGLFLRSGDLAKIGYLYLNNGMWNGKRLVSADWVKQSLTPQIDTWDGMKYGYLWWLYSRKDSSKVIWMGLGLGGQRLMVLPGEQVIAVITGWQLLKEDAPLPSLVDRLLPAIEIPSCDQREH